jgi:hypothetical protein
MIGIGASTHDSPKKQQTTARVGVRYHRIVIENRSEFINMKDQLSVSVVGINIARDTLANQLVGFNRKVTPKKHRL